MDARDLLRRYLEQRRDLGETELVLDSLSVDDALALLGAKAGASPSSAPAESPPSGVTRTADWREAIRAAGGAPEGEIREKKREEPMPRRPDPAPQPPNAVSRDAVHVPTTQTGALTTSPLGDVPAGLVVGGASRALFDDPAAKLNSLEEIAAVVASCRRCALYATALNPVPGVGNPNAGFMCVGEAPGANAASPSSARRASSSTRSSPRSTSSVRTCSLRMSSSIVLPVTATRCRTKWSPARRIWSARSSSCGRR